MNILISGAGIAGLAAAFWLKKFGHQPVVVERAPELREGGYMIDFWGLGFDVAEKMGIIEELRQKHYPIPEFEFVDESGKRVGGFNVNRLRRLIDLRHFNMLRGDLARVLYDQVRSDAEFIFGNSVAAIEDGENSVSVEFADGTRKDFDLVLGADGLHSNVRQMVFGPESRFARHLGYYVASFTIDNYLDESHVFQSHAVKGKWVGIYGVGEGKLATFFICKSERREFPHHDTEAQQEILRENFRDVRWECPALLEKMSSAPDFYFDDVSQIEMDDWTEGRVALIGDACQCVSPVAGKGASLAMAGAYILAGELKRAGGDHREAFALYQEKMKPEAVYIQKMGRDFASSFVPDTSFGLWVRNKFTNLMFWPIISQWVVKKYLSDAIELEDY
ncbi:MAG: FAD-dependent monooxygenase [Pyrinomonadaceae bacterium]